ncbi:unnamed protein product [Rotaria sp. Silwood2]|nr:unnamed protein product [Rotaria sp. Silwood2]CAF3153246.1 unnamed protein product [Rotaria sp. Silwood2]CAF3412404.1 unnamed protein product [Rotaria sp. Silwood2]CAF4491554.1 unnamed protein product [Rotaria sp. Silwood2]CAF4591823.1 unnamed protein product [Rotaria sp. Silwood2]
MFRVDINDELKLIQVKTNEESKEEILAEGYFIFDEPGHAVLVIFEYINILPEDYCKLGQLLSTFILHLGQHFKSLICLRLPVTFDNRIDFNKLEFKSNISNFMAVKNDNLKHYADRNIESQQDQYVLITDKQLILGFAESLYNILKQEAYWCATLTLEEMKNRINSSAHIAMILDKTYNQPCGYGRLFLLKTNTQLFGYMSDVAINSSHQSKGLGSILINHFVGTFLKKYSELENINGTLCLLCADKGNGAISAPKIYRKAGFEYLNDLGNRIAIFSNRDFR